MSEIKSTIIFSGEYDYKDHLEVLSTYYKQTMKKRDKKMIRVLGIGIILFSIYEFISDFNWSIFIMLILGIFYLLPGTYILRFGAYINFLLSHPFMPIKFTINNRIVKYKNKLPGIKTIKWQSYSKYIYADNMILLARPVMIFPSMSLITFIPKRFLKDEEWKELSAYVKYREEQLKSKKQPNRFILWTVRALFIIFTECALWNFYTLYLNLTKYNFDTNNPPFVFPLLLLTFGIPFYAKWINFQKYSIKRNLLFPLIAFLIFVVGFFILVIF